MLFKNQPDTPVIRSFAFVGSLLTITVFGSSSLPLMLILLLKPGTWSGSYEVKKKKGVRLKILRFSNINISSLTPGFVPWFCFVVPIEKSSKTAVMT